MQAASVNEFDAKKLVTETALMDTKDWRIVTSTKNQCKARKCFAGNFERDTIYVFYRLCDAVAGNDNFFLQNRDAAGKLGYSTFQKVTTKDIWKSKLYKDKLKTVLSSKMDLNQFVESFPNSYKRSLPVYIPFIIMASLEATVYVLYLGANGLYIINEVTNISLPRTLFEVKDGGISKVVSSLNIVKKLVIDVKQMNQEITELRGIKKRKTIKQITASQMGNNQGDADCKKWIRPIWFPPKYESDSDE